MKTAQKEMQQRMERFQEVCRTEGIKLTHQRIEIFREVAQSGEHPDAETVYAGVRERMPTVSLDTVYRTLWLLNDLDLIKTLGPGRERTRFDANLDKHHHFSCTQCGMTRDFYSDELDHLKLSDQVKSLGIAETAQVEVRGVCHTCTEHTDNNSINRKD